MAGEVQNTQQTQQTQQPNLPRRIITTTTPAPSSAVIFAGSVMQGNSIGDSFDAATQNIREVHEANMNDVRKVVNTGKQMFNNVVEWGKGLFK